jgi:hypothetical protein
MSGGCRKESPFFMPSRAPAPEQLSGAPLNTKGPTMPFDARTAATTPQDAGTRAPRRPPFSRKRVVSQLWRTAERQVTEIETRMLSVGDDPQALERDAKTLAIIAKTVRDLVAIDGEAGEQAKSKENKAAHGSKNARPEPNAAGDENGPRDIEGFRAELARRLDELRREREGGGTP